MSADWIGLACEFHLDGELVRGDVHDLKSGGFLVETTAAPEPGMELELRLVGGAARRPIFLRAVTERRQKHNAASTMNSSGIQFRLMRYSHDYSLLMAGEDLGDSDGNPAQQHDRNERRESEREWLSNMLDSEEATAPDASTPVDLGAQWEDYEPLPERAGTPLFSEDSLAPEAIVIDDGELDDVVQLLSEIGIKAERRSPDADSLLSSWIAPQHLLVVSAKRALELRLPLGNERQKFVSFAVAESGARMVCSAVRRLGYQFAISRPIHPSAMSMLFRQAIFDQHEQHDQRVAPREVMGCSVTWWRSWGRKQPGVILDASAGGCQLLVRTSAARGAKIKIQVPSGVVDQRALKLPGHIVRSIGGSRGTTLGVTFDALSSRDEVRLQKFLALPGPCQFAGETLLPQRQAECDVPIETEPSGERRKNYRAEVRREVVALEHASFEVLHLLVSSDLSCEGMRIEPHPALSLGDQMDIALYEDIGGTPLILAAVVARDDARLGWWLRFVDVGAEDQERLARALDRFPPVMRLTDPDAELARVTLSQVVLQGEREAEVEESCD